MARAETHLKTAKALGIDVPPMLVARADEVIELPRSPRPFLLLSGEKMTRIRGRGSLHQPHGEQDEQEIGA